MRIFDMKKKEVINICDCKRLGFVGDVEFDPAGGCITHLIVPGPGCLAGIFGREKEYVIPFCDVKQIGRDIILVEIRELKDVEKVCPIL
ncbi:MAG: YlmC/YmxH family sporulation protein [Clostridiales bacterium]|nr:YlmC/YmxH family sporulation protein [Clostridiales bacterium]